jgi:hypothetical protein
MASRGSAEPASEAHLDPWCHVGLHTGETVLFGYAKAHPVTGGLAWAVTSELVELNRARNGARTMSRRSYVLGRRFDAIDVGAEGEEARLAFELLVGRDYERADDLVMVDRLWLAARKAARQLGVEPPARTNVATRAFFDRHIKAYSAVRQRGWGPKT